MKNNDVLQKDVQDAIKWESLLHTSEIGVIARDGVVTLSGTVDSFEKKTEAEDAAKKVAGVKAVVEKITVKLSTQFNKNDNDIARDILDAFKWNWEIPADRLKIKVEDGWVTIEGEVEWIHQKATAKKTVSKLIGVKGITNNIIIKSNNLDKVEKKGIEQAFIRHWALEDRRIQVEVTGNIVTLLGTVNSWYQRDEAGRIAWNAPGVYSVNNEIVIEHQKLADEK